MAVTQSVPSEVFGSSPALPRYVDAVVLGAGTAESYTPPTGSVYALLTCDLPIYARIGGTAAAPATEVTDGTASFYIAAGIQVRIEAGVAISLIRATASSTIVTIGVYKN